ncbi:MAG: reverse transcriptase family protein, partial [Thermoguttaceae bacterium]
NQQCERQHPQPPLRPPFDQNNQVIPKIRRIEQLRGKRIVGKVSEFAASLPRSNSKPNSYGQLLNPDYDAFRTLRKNEALVDEVLKTLETSQSINTLTTYETKEFDVTKCNFHINNEEVCAIFDSGASFSVISKSFAEKMNLPINHSHQEKMLLANNQTARTHGIVNDIPLANEKVVFFCDAIVLHEAAQTLLLGVNFQKKYSATIEYETNKMSLVANDTKYCLPISTNKIYRTHKLTEHAADNQKSFLLRSKENVTILAGETHHLKVFAPRPLSVVSNCLLVVSAMYPDLHVAQGVFDTNSPIWSVLCSNFSNHEKHLYSCSPVAVAEVCEGASVFDPTLFECAFDIHQILASFKGCEKSKIEFENRLTELVKEKITKKSIPLEHKIALSDGKQQICSKQFWTNLCDKERIEEQIKEMLKLEVIRESTSKFSSSIVLVKKKDHTTRFCIDYRTLNRYTITNRYPIPRLDDTIDSLKNAKYFSKIDLKNGYWHVPINETDKRKTAFRSHIGLFEFNVMPFGLLNAPSTFQHIINTIFSKSNWQFSLIYLDDVIIYSTTEEEHLQHVIEILREIRN